MFVMERSRIAIYTFLTNFLFLILTCRASNAQNDFIVKLLSNQMEFLLRQQDALEKDIEHLSTKLEMEISARKKLTETVLVTESLVVTQQRDIEKIKAHLLKEHDRNRYLLHNNTLLATELNRLRKGITAEKRQRHILTNALNDIESDVQQLRNSNGSNSCANFNNFCTCCMDENHSNSTDTTVNDTTDKPAVPVFCNIERSSPCSQVSFVNNGTKYSCLGKNSGLEDHEVHIYSVYKATREEWPIGKNRQNSISIMSRSGYTFTNIRTRKNVTLVLMSHDPVHWTLSRSDNIKRVILYSSSEAEVHGDIAHVDIQRSKGFYGFGENETVLHPFFDLLVRSLGTVTSFTGIHTSPKNTYLLTDVPRCKDCSGLSVNDTTKPTPNVLVKCQPVHVVGNIEKRADAGFGESFKSARFTTLGATGNIGPTTLGRHYFKHDHERLVTLNKGIQCFTVPRTSNYRITVAGAAGGFLRSGSPARGSRISGTFYLQKGTTLKILVGQTGRNFIDKQYYVTGGGGGSFVTHSDDSPLIVAGGGGGLYMRSYPVMECHGSVDEEGSNGYADPPWGHHSRSGCSGHGAYDSSFINGPGGGGLFSRGSDQRKHIFVSGSGGSSFVDGGEGGIENSRADFRSDGGFGGGGSAGRGPGGGGGYSGGSGGCSENGSCGGGGGSYNGGKNKYGLSGANRGVGYVLIQIRLP